MIPAWIVALPTLAAIIAGYAAKVYLDEWLKAELKLAAIFRARSAATRKGNRTRAAKRRALRDATTQQLKENGPRQA